jgi:hypothetical protein
MSACPSHRGVEHDHDFGNVNLEKYVPSSHLSIFTGLAGGDIIIWFLFSVARSASSARFKLLGSKTFEGFPPILP